MSAKALPLGTCDHCDAALFIIFAGGKHAIYPIVGDREVVIRHAWQLVVGASVDEMLEDVQDAVLVFTAPPFDKFVLDDDGMFALAEP